jgi:hypothetical protein
MAHRTPSPSSKTTYSYPYAFCTSTKVISFPWRVSCVVFRSTVLKTRSVIPPHLPVSASAIDRQTYVSFCALCFALSQTSRSFSYLRAACLLSHFRASPVCRCRMLAVHFPHTACWPGRGCSNGSRSHLMRGGISHHHHHRHHPFVRTTCAACDGQSLSH